MLFFLEDLTTVELEFGSATVISDHNGVLEVLWIGEQDIAEMRLTMKLAGLELELTNSSREEEIFTALYNGLQEKLDELTAAK